MLTIFYDGACPLCVKEMDALRGEDRAGSLVFVDLHSDHLQKNHPQVDFNAAMRILHAEQDGKMLKGLDATAAAWRTVGKKPWVQCIRWPVVRWFFDLAYLMFARNRYRLSWLFTGQSQCQVGKACEIKRLDK